VSVSAVSAVLFARDLNKVAGFYRDVLGMPCTAKDAQHAVLVCKHFDLIIHQLPPSETEPAAAPLQRRHTAAIRLNFTIADIAQARRVAASLGGEVDDAPPAWAPPDARCRLGHDPEGNVFLVDE
jgi:catechol-2,3-dioxygenase